MEHKHDNEAALSTRIRFRLKTQLFLSVFKKIASTREQENGVFEKFHFGERFIVYVHVDGRSIRKKRWRFQKNPDRGLWFCSMVPIELPSIYRNRCAIMHGYEFCISMYS